jgi:nicotinamide mononucleotide adenylyltransferase
MKDLFNYIIESSTTKAKNQVVIVQGRFQPPTLGHLKAVKAAYKKYKLPVVINIVHGAGSSRPFDTDIQREMFDKMLKGIPHEILVSTTGFLGVTVDELRKANKEPVAVFTGSDRVKKYRQQSEYLELKANADIEVHEIPRTGTDVSATQVRTALATEDEKLFKKLTHKSVHSMFDQLVAGMKA